MCEKATVGELWKGFSQPIDSAPSQASSGWTYVSPPASTSRGLENRRTRGFSLDSQLIGFAER